MESRSFYFRIDAEEYIDYDEAGNKIGGLDYSLFLMPENKRIITTGFFKEILDAIQENTLLYEEEDDV